MGQRRTRKALHPAIAALRAAHDEMRAHMAGKGVGACFDSDLAHDERAIAKSPDEPFVWLVSPHATYMARLGTTTDCLAATCGSWSNHAARIMIKSLCEECYERSAIPDGWLRLYIWNASLVRYQSADALLEATAQLIRDMATASLMESRTCPSELLAAARADDASWRIERHSQEISEIESRIAKLQEWGP